MATFEVTTPDGARYRIEGAGNQAQALQVFQQKFGKATPDSVVAPSIPNRTFSEGVVRGMRDPIDAGAQLLTHGLAGGAGLAAKYGVPGAPPVAKYMTGQARLVDKINQKAEQDYEKTHPTSTAKVGRALGNVITTLPFFSSEAPATLPRAIAEGAGQGGLMGALQPVENPGDNFAGKKTKQVIEGVEYGAPAAGLFNVAHRVISPNTAEDVKTLLKAGVTPTTGEILGGTADRLEGAAQSIPFVGTSIAKARGRALNSFVRANINNALAPIGEKLDAGVRKLGQKAINQTGHDAIDEAERKIGGRFQSLVPKSGIVADNTFTTNFRNLISNANTMAPERVKQFGNIVRDKVLRKFSPGGGMTGESFKEVESDLGRLGKQYLHSADPDQRQLGTALFQLQNEFRDQLARSNPQIADELGKTREAYARLKVVQRAASNVGANEGEFTPSQLLRASRAKDPTMDHARFAKGQARMQSFAQAGKNVLSEKVPNSGSIDRLAALGILGGVGTIEPTTAATIAGTGLTAMGAYSKIGQKLINPLLSQRPEVAAKLANVLRRLQIPRGIAAYGVTPND